METVNILFGIYGFDNFLFVDVLRQWELYYTTGNALVVVEFFDGVEEFLFCNIVFEADEVGDESNFLADLHFEAYIRFATTIMPN